MDVCSWFAALAENELGDDWLASRWAQAFYVWTLLSPHPGQRPKYMAMVR